MIIKTRAFPRAALIGNPSDGYNGKTIAFVFGNYAAEVQLYESPELDLLPSLRDHSTFHSLEDLAQDVGIYGYYGGIRLLKASIKSFYDYCRANRLTPDQRNFTMRYATTIPNRLGLAGSSAIITACMRALCHFYHISIPKAKFANLVLSVERDELGIPAGLQDRVAQSYNQPVYMDFDADFMARHGHGRYEEIVIPPELNLYIAYRTDLAEGSEILHSRLREDYDNGVRRVLDAMREWAHLTDLVRDKLRRGELDELPVLLNRNFDLRCEVCGRSVSEKNRRMVELARNCGASAKFTGSGGAIIGTYTDESMYQKLCEALKAHDIVVIKPRIVNHAEAGDVQV